MRSCDPGVAQPVEGEDGQEQSRCGTAEGEPPHCRWGRCRSKPVPPAPVGRLALSQPEVDGLSLDFSLGDLSGQHTQPGSERQELILQAAASGTLGEMGLHRADLALGNESLKML